LEQDRTRTDLEDVIAALEDGRESYYLAAALLREAGDGTLARRLTTFAEHRALLAVELKTMAATHGTGFDETGSTSGMLHRGWMAIWDTVRGDDTHSVLTTAEQGEEHVVAEYEHALSSDGLSPDERGVLARQLSEIKTSRDDLRALRDRAA
jgi:uncharacterized protein (TIGR02284 family)